MPGLFDGIEMRSQQDVLRERAQKQAQEFEQILPNSGPESQRTFMRLGGMLGRGLNPGQIPDQQRNQMQAVQAAKARFDDWKKLNPDSTLENQGLEGQKYLAEELLRVGDQNGMMLASAYAEQLAARRKADLEEKRLSADIEQTQMQTRAGWSKMGQESIQDVYLPGSQYGDNPISAWIGEDNNAYDTKNGNLIAKAGEYFTNPPPDTTKGSRMRPSDFGIGVGEAKFMRDQATNIMGAADNFLSMQQILVDAAKTGSIEFMSKSGAVTGFVVDLIDNATALARTAEKAIADDTGTTPDSQRLKVDGFEDDLSVEANARRYVEQNPQLVVAMKDSIPKTARISDAMKQRWVAAMTRTAYSLARAQDPGQRGVSNEDFQNAVRALGAATTSPEAFRQITNTNIHSQIQNFRDRIMFISPEARQAVLSPAGMARFDDRMRKFDAAFGTNFGQAGAPGKGLTNPSGEESDDDFLNRALQ